MDTQVNRAKVLWENWEKRVSKIQTLTGNIDDKQTLKYKYKFLTDGLHRLSVNPSEKEKLYTHAINIVTAKLRKQLYPNPIVRFIHGIQNALINRPIHLLLLKDWKKESVNQIQEQLKSSGLNHYVGKIEKELDFEREKIHLKSISNVNGSDRLEIDIHLKKIDETAYVYNGYTATFITESGESKSATFFPSHNINVSEALNLLEGRPIYKCLNNSEPKMWMNLGQIKNVDQGNLQLIKYSLDFEYDLKKLLLDHSIKLEVYGISVNAVQKAIESGNKVAFEVPEKGKFYLSANLSENKINFFDAESKPITISDLKKITKPINQVPNKDLKIIKQRRDIEPENQLQVSR